MMAWARPDNLHSKLVFWFKILLPLGALAILSTLFMVSRTVRPEDAIPYADVDVADLVQQPRLTHPNFAGMTSDGAALTLTADEARLGVAGSGEDGTISGLFGLLETPDGARTELDATSARLDSAGRRMILADGVTISNSTGYRIETQEISVALDRTSLDSTGPITAIGPVGQIAAGALHLGLSGSNPRSYVLVFKSGVHMIYLPARQGAGN
jgi:lipopolysaccharide export system protein LptC